MNELPKDLVTLLFRYLSNQSKLSLLTAYPKLGSRIDWSVLYNQKYNLSMVQLRKLHSKYFPITKRERLKCMKDYYNQTDMHLLDINALCECVGKHKCETCLRIQDDYDLRNIPILDSTAYKLEDYIHDIQDYIYEDIIAIKKDEQRVCL